MSNRRQVLGSAAGLAAGLAIGGIPILRRSSSLAASPGTLDEMRIAMAALPPQLDPQTNQWIVMRRIYRMLFDTLVDVDWDQGGILVPSLAESWEQVDDVTYSFTLREGAVFHNGLPVTSEDVKFTFERTLSDDERLSTRGQFPIDDITIVDQRRFTITTVGPRGGFLMALTRDGASILSQDAYESMTYEEFQRLPVGAGPFRITEFIPDQALVLEAHDQYWAGRSAASNVRVTAIPEVSTRVAALINGEVDLITDLPADQLGALESRGDFAISSVAPLNVNIILFVSDPPVDKKEIRQAMSLGFDRGAIVEQLLGGYGVWPTSTQMTVDPLYSERPPMPYDPDRARALLDDADYAGEEIKLVYDTPNYYPLQLEWVQAMVGMWGDIGLNVTMHPMEVSQRVLVGPGDGWHASTTSSAAVIADFLKLEGYARPDGYMQAQFTDQPDPALDEFNRTFEIFEQSVDPAERRELARQLYDFLDFEYVPAIPQFTINRISAARGGIKFQETRNFGIELRPGKFSVTA